MKWLTNTYNPELNDAQDYFVVLQESPYSPAEQWQHFLDFLKTKIIGLPKATEHFTVEQLQEMNMVGVYDSEQQA